MFRFHYKTPLMISDIQQPFRRDASRRRRRARSPLRARAPPPRFQTLPGMTMSALSLVFGGRHLVFDEAQAGAMAFSHFRATGGAAHAADFHYMGALYAGSAGRMGNTPPRAIAAGVAPHMAADASARGRRDIRVDATPLLPASRHLAIHRVDEPSLMRCRLFYYRGTRERRLQHAPFFTKALYAIAPLAADKMCRR